MHILGYPKNYHSQKSTEGNDSLGISKFYQRLILAQYILNSEGSSNVSPPIEQIRGANGLFSGHYNE